MTAPKTAAFSDGTPIPVFWEKCILAAYYRLLGGTQKQASAAVGRNERTIRTWEADTALWARASEEARQRWLGEVIAVARRRLLQGMLSAEADLALKLLERIDAELAPATQRHKVHHEVSAGLSGLLQAFGETDGDPD
jgi:hypothetical protein